MEIDFAPPGPGEWSLDRSHYPGGATPISQWLITEGFAGGFDRVFAELGMPAERLDARFVNGFMYTRLRPLIGADKPAGKLPPTFVLRLVVRLHPTFRARAKQAEITLRDRPSNEVAQRWRDEIRPDLRAKNLEFQEVQPDLLDDEQLRRHVGALLDHLHETFELHFWLHGHDLGPIARYLYECIEWGLEPTASIEALAGASPSTGHPAQTLGRLRSLVEESGGTVTSLDDVRAVSDEARSLLDDYLTEHGHLLVTGYDLTASTLVELPDVVLLSIRTAAPPPSHQPEARASELRERLPGDVRAHFDMLLADARNVMDMRDDNGPLTAEWPTGLLRRALLAAGRRLVERGELGAAEHLFELTPDEARSLFTTATPDATDLEQRAGRRAEAARATPPPTLGDRELEPPLDVLPDSLATLVAMVQVSLEYLGMDGTATGESLAGVGIGAMSYTGRARVTDSADEAIERLEPGDVLVVRATSPAFNVVLAIAGAVVTADGGALSHAAVLARELGIPAVVGAPGALSIPDGSVVEVDPTQGSVRVVGAS
jgi:pyruvate,water dikinase